MMLSVIPSDRYSALGSALALTRGMIASEFIAFLDRFRLAEGDDRPEPDGALLVFLALWTGASGFDRSDAVLPERTVPASVWSKCPRSSFKSISRLNRLRSISKSRAV